MSEQPSRRKPGSCSCNASRQFSSPGAEDHRTRLAPGSRFRCGESLLEPVFRAESSAVRRSSGPPAIVARPHCCPQSTQLPPAHSRRRAAGRVHLFDRPVDHHAPVNPAPWQRGPRRTRATGPAEPVAMVPCRREPPPRCRMRRPGTPPVEDAAAVCRARIHDSGARAPRATDDRNSCNPSQESRITHPWRATSPERRRAAAGQ
jgi:hypothetical protein